MILPDLSIYEELVDWSPDGYGVIVEIKLAGATEFYTSARQIRGWHRGAQVAVGHLIRDGIGAMRKFRVSREDLRMLFIMKR